MTNQPHTLTRCLGKVVRCEARDDRFIIAINFVSPPPELTQKLSDFTLKLQRIETEGEGGRGAGEGDPPRREGAAAASAASGVARGR